MSINTELDFKNWICLREKEAYNSKSNIIYFGAIFFEVRVRFASDSFQGTFVDFRFMMFSIKS